MKMKFSFFSNLTLFGQAKKNKLKFGLRLEQEAQIEFLVQRVRTFVRKVKLNLL